MTEPETMREYLNRPVTADEAETEGRWDRIMIKQNDPILDAHIIRGTSADAPVWVIAPEAWEAFVDAVHYLVRDHDPRARQEAEDNATDFLQALLPGARRAKEVQTVAVPANMLEVKVPVFDVPTELMPDGRDRYYTIAILHNEQEKEHE